MNERRRERLGAFVESALPHFFREELEVPAGTIISIVHVDVKTSGQSALVHVSVYPETHTDQVANMLKKSENKAAHYVRTHLRTKYAPVINFRVVRAAR